MKKCFFILILAVTAYTVTAQKDKPKEDFYIFKSDWQPASTTKEATYFARLMKISDTCWQWDVYNYMGPMILSFHYKDEKQTQVHGRQLYYKPSGYMDSCGLVENGSLHGDWLYYNDTGKAVMKKEYNHGMLLAVTDLTKKNDTAVKDELSYDDERESSFPGGITKWQQYLLKNLRYPDRALQASIMGEVVAQFMVDATGVVHDAEIFKSVEYSLDQETIRLLKKSPKWTPAWQNGKHVKSYKRQPLRYKFS